MVMMTVMMMMAIMMMVKMMTMLNDDVKDDTKLVYLSSQLQLLLIGSALSQLSQKPCMAFHQGILRDCCMWSPPAEALLLPKVNAKTQCNNDVMRLTVMTTINAMMTMTLMLIMMTMLLCYCCC